MQLSKMLKIKPGITSVIGGGGKTSLIHMLAEDLDGTVVICSTTHMYPSERFKAVLSSDIEDIEAALKSARIICAGEPCGEGKIRLSVETIDRIAEIAEYVLVEADGARQKPMKAHGEHEPVIPENSRETICVLGASVFGQAIKEKVHRPEIFIGLTGASADTLVTPALCAEVIQKEGFSDRIFINQIETPETYESVLAFASLTGLPVVGGSLQQRQYFVL